MAGIRREREGPLAVLRLDKSRGNAIDEGLVGELRQACADLEADDSVRGVLLASAHPKLFCPGLDLVSLVEYDRARLQRFMSAFGLMLSALYGLRKPVVADLQSIYRAATAAEAEQHLAELEAKWKAYPSVSQVWRRNWARITPFFNYPPDIRRAIYTTNAVESLNRSLRKIIKTRGGFPNEEAALKLLFLALRQAAKKWTMPIHHWREALNHFTVLWPERMPALERVAS